MTDSLAGRGLDLTRIAEGLATARRSGYGNTQLFDDLGALLAACRALREALQAAAKVLEGFDAGVFVRNTDNDSAPGWAVKALPYIAALAELSRGVLAQTQDPGTQKTVGGDPSS